MLDFKSFKVCLSSPPPPERLDHWSVSLVCDVISAFYAYFFESSAGENQRPNVAVQTNYPQNITIISRLCFFSLPLLQNLSLDSLLFTGSTSLGLNVANSAEFPNKEAPVCKVEVRTLLSW